MDVEEFVAGREERWKSLEALLVVAEESPVFELGRERLLELVRLYRLSCTDLNHLRSLTANPQLLDRLNQLVGRGYRFVYSQAGRPRWGAVRQFFLRDVPATFQHEKRWVLSAALSLGLGAAVGFSAMVLEPENASALIPPAFYSESASERVHRIEQ